MDGFHLILRRGHACIFRTLASTAFVLAVATGAANAAQNAGQSMDQNDDSDVVGYDSIVNDLGREANRNAVSRARAAQAVGSSVDPMENIWFHGGVGLATLMETINFDDGSHTFIGQKGMQVSGGIDLFSPVWMAEATIRNFGESEDSSTHVSLKEFELKLVYHDHLSHKLGFHAGGGLSARYMSIRQPQAISLDYTTPTSVATLGGDFFVAERLSVGVEVSARNSMISETVDRSSVDAAIRLDVQL